MTWVGDTEIGLLVALVLVLLWLLWVFGRRRWLGRQGGTFDCSARLATTVTGRGWVLGVARYSGDWLEWHRVFGLSVSPRLRFHRSDTAIVDQRTPTARETLSLYEGQRIISLVGALPDERPVEIALGAQELTGLMSWFEGAPPGRGRVEPRVG
ncbi:MAG TPA: DUF2550 domain-containing protein [Propionibacteriaceae bacterium]|nr:DUF2550 domain-containing protein [Propionibacteriaceae bacterium]